MITEYEAVTDSETFSKTFLKILDKKERLIPFRWNKMQRDFHRNKTGRDLVLKSRQLGCSTYEQGDIFKSLVTKTTRALTLSHDDTTTQILRQTADRFYNYCEFGSIKPSRKYANATMTVYSDFDSMHVIGTAGNTEIGRGGSYSRIHGSEAAKWKDAEKIIAGAMQGGNPAVVLESTPNGAQGYFYERCMEAISGAGIWKIHFYPWWWDESYRIIIDASEFPFILTADEELLKSIHGLVDEQIKWRRNKQKELGRFFPQEYPEDPVTCFLTSGNSYFGDLTGVFTAPLNPEWQEGHKYIAGLDFGQANDFTCLIVIDCTIRAVVDMLHINKLPWAELRSRIVQMYNKWKVSRLIAESNSIGQVNIEALRAEGLGVVPFETTNDSKAGVMSTLNESLQSGLKLQDNPIVRHELSIFVAMQSPITKVWRLAAEGSGHDDTVIALALANYGINVTPLPKEQPRQASKWLEQETQMQTDEIEPEYKGWTKRY